MSNNFDKCSLSWHVGTISSRNTVSIGKISNCPFYDFQVRALLEHIPPRQFDNFALALQQQRKGCFKCSQNIQRHGQLRLVIEF